jgi:PBP1b-binding outer membrane lipoprotein LpoB
MKKLVTLPTLLLLTVFLAGCSISNPFAAKETPTPVAMAKATATPAPQVLSTPEESTTVVSSLGDQTYNA